ncbi:sorting nexin-5-like [Plakobranchus ocellatus]|uniref:Sorting nexin-5-like n=1 Tax=Plakobranchus ocellatus TaxID=259542 RepID=A0AAV4DU47_9GAST|nr:sorting nexin-5-like [Plakobranchus ocellatus]
MEEEDDTTKSFAQTSNGETEGQDLPLYRVHVPEAVKRAENVMFTLQVTVAKDEKGCVILRQFEDFEWLHHNLITGNDIKGLIVPPLPVKPLSDPKSAESLSKKQMGEHTRIMRGDQFEHDCLSVQKYLELMLSHPIFGKDKNLASFLTEQEAPVRAKLNKGLITRLSSAIDTARKSSRKDLDEFYNTQRTFAADYSKAIKEASLNYNKMLVAQWRLSSSYSTVATELTSCTADRDEELVKLNRVLKALSDGCEDEATCYELKSAKGETTLGFYLDLFARYSDSLKEMHFRRVNDLIEYEASEKALEKAKPPKRQLAEETFDSAKTNFEKCSEKGRAELNRFTQIRLATSGSCLAEYAELQVKISQDFYTQLLHSRRALDKIHL